MYISDLKIACEKNLPIIIIFLSDEGFGSIRTRALKNQLSQNSLLMNSPSWYDVVKGFGIKSLKVKNLTQLKNALEKWDIAQGAMFIECKMDKNKYQKMMLGLRE